MFTVTNCGHVHATVEEARWCVYRRPVVYTPPTPVQAASRPYTPARDWRDDAGTMSRQQHGYLIRLGAHEGLFKIGGKRLSMNQASRLIDDIKSGLVDPSKKKGRPRVDPEYAQKLEFIDGLLDMVPDGYFAVRRQEGDPITFMRISRPTRGQYKGCIKVQTQHGPSLEVRLIKWPSERWTVYLADTVDKMMLVVTDFQGAMMTYSQEIGKCCRCNTELTDERSRWYGIGPECEKSFGWVIARVNEERGEYVPGAVHN